MQVIVQISYCYKNVTWKEPIAIPNIQGRRTFCTNPHNGSVNVHVWAYDWGCSLNFIRWNLLLSKTSFVTERQKAFKAALAVSFVFFPPPKLTYMKNKENVLSEVSFVWNAINIIQRGISDFKQEDIAFQSWKKTLICHQIKQPTLILKTFYSECG